MQVNVNLAGLPALVLPCGFVERASNSLLPVGLQMIGAAFDEVVGSCTKFIIQVLNVCFLLMLDLAVNHCNCICHLLLFLYLSLSTNQCSKISIVVDFIDGNKLTSYYRKGYLKLDISLSRLFKVTLLSLQ